LAPKALLNDGLLDTFSISEFSVMDIPEVLGELQKSVSESGSNNRFIRRFRVPWFEIESDHPIPFNLDGEPCSASRIHFSVLPQAIRVLLPQDCPCLE
jgi:diacylglycerol kinase family enzyme